MCFGTITKLHSVYKMDHVSYFKALLESVPAYRKIVLLMYSKNMILIQLTIVIFERVITNLSV